MRFLKDPTEPIRAIAFDVDNTVYPPNRAYRQHQQSVDIATLAEHLRVDEATARREFRSLRMRMFRASGVLPSSAQVLKLLGLDRRLLLPIRSALWTPENYLSPDPSTSDLLTALSQRFFVGFVTNSPKAIARRVLLSIGFAAGEVVPIWSPEDGQAKPNVDLFRQLGAHAGLAHSQILGVGDDECSDGIPCLALGMPTLLVDGPTEIAAGLFALGIQVNSATGRD